MIYLKRLVSTTCLHLLFLTVIKSQKCERIKIGNEFYKRSLVANTDGYATGIVIDPRTENIFFILHKRNYTRGIHVLKFGSLGIRELHIGDDFKGQCVAVDRVNNIVYIGTNQGIVTYDNAKNEVFVERPIGDDDVRSIFIDKSDNQMYITTSMHHEVFYFVNGTTAVRRFEKVPKAYNFILDSKGNVFYEYIDGKLYTFPMDLFEPFQYKGFTRELKYVMQLNNNDEAIVAVKGSMFHLDTKCVVPTKIAQFGFRITGMAFDNKNNIYVATKGKIYKYKVVDSSEPCPSDDYFMTGI